MPTLFTRVVPLPFREMEERKWSQRSFETPTGSCLDRLSSLQDYMFSLVLFSCRPSPARAGEATAAGERKDGRRNVVRAYGQVSFVAAVPSTVALPEKPSPSCARGARPGQAPTQ